MIVIFLIHQTTKSNTSEYQEKQPKFKNFQITKLCVASWLYGQNPQSIPVWTLVSSPLLPKKRILSAYFLTNFDCALQVDSHLCRCFLKNYWTPISWNILHEFRIFTFFSWISDFTDPMTDFHSLTSFRTSPRDIFGNFTVAILINWNDIDKEMNWTLPLNVPLITMLGFHLIFLSLF